MDLSRFVTQRDTEVRRRKNEGKVRKSKHLGKLGGRNSRVACNPWFQRVATPSRSAPRHETMQANFSVGPGDVVGALFPGPGRQNSAIPAADPEGLVGVVVDVSAQN